MSTALGPESPHFDQTETRQSRSLPFQHEANLVLRGIEDPSHFPSSTHVDRCESQFRISVAVSGLWRMVMHWTAKLSLPLFDN